jgi:menaquinol-cytochrome c reductase iron-sulfur subunit
MSMEESGVDVKRRAVLGGVIKVAIGAVAAAVGVPIVGFILTPLLAAKESHWHEVGALDNFRPSTTVLTIFPLNVQDGWVQATRSTAIYVRRGTQNDFSVFSPKCTHLGCATQWNSNTQQFFCPCHGGVFDAEGKVVAGPVPRALDRYETKVENGRLYVGSLKTSA